MSVSVFLLLYLVSLFHLIDDCCCSFSMEPPTMKLDPVERVLMVG